MRIIIDFTSKSVLIEDKNLDAAQIEKILVELSATIYFLRGHVVPRKHGREMQ